MNGYEFISEAVWQRRDAHRSHQQVSLKSVSLLP